jgi:uncharacterized peroxidase-related enzyme
MTHHRRGLRQLLKDDALLERIEADHKTADLSDRRTAMLQYVSKLNRTPKDMGPEDVENLRAHEFSDTDILHIAEVAAYYAYVNRIADGLGVEVEAE